MIKLLDCTIRDGGYVNNWDFSKDFVQDLCSALNKCNYDYMEIGFRNLQEIYNNNIPNIWRSCKEKDISFIDNNIKLAVMCDNSKFDINLFNNKSKISMVRIAFHKDEIQSAINNAGKIKKLNYEVCLNAMGTILYNDVDLYKLCKGYLNSNSDYLYIADSYGCMNINDISSIKNKLVKYCKEIDPDKILKIGFHAHNNLQNGITNAMYCINNGFDIVDTTVMGMGRGAGNASTELLLSNISDKFEQSYNPHYIIEFINKHMSSEFITNRWGYNIPYFISGHLKCHPTYITKILEYKIFDYEKIWTIINNIVEAKKNNKFDIKYLDKTILEIM